MSTFTTRERLARKIYGNLKITVFDYGDYVVRTLEHRIEGIKVEIYELIETSEETGLERCECRLSQIAENYGFKDIDHAVKWALAEIK